MTTAAEPEAQERERDDEQRHAIRTPGTIEAIDLYERDVRLRMPFRFGVVTLTEAPQAFARVRVRLADGRRAEGGAAELLAPKWFDKDPALSNEDNFDQLRRSLGIARELYLAGGAGDRLRPLHRATTRRRSTRRPRRA